MDEFYVSGGLLYGIWVLAALGLIVASGLVRVRTQFHSNGASGWVEAGDPPPIIGLVLVSTLILLIGFRPPLAIYFDMSTYAREFQAVVAGYTTFEFKDPVFQILLVFLGLFRSLSFFFVAIAAIYIGAKSLALSNWLGRRWILLLPAIITTFHFYAYGVNTIRQGVAASVFLLALLSGKWRWRIAFSTLAVGLHVSLLMAVGAMLAVRAHRNTKSWLIVWALSATIGILAPTGTFAQVGDWVGRGSTYFSTDGLDFGYVARLRLDFIAYSLVGVCSVTYWRVFRKLEDERYTDLANTFVLLNAIWIIVHKIPYTDRVAYPSWMLMDIVVLAPFLLVPQGFRFLPFLGLAAANILLTLAIA